MKLAIALLLSLCVAVYSQATPGWNLVWNDEFDGPGLDTTKWSHEVNCWGGGNNELQCYTDRPTNTRVVNGSLVISARVEEYVGTYDKCTLNTQSSCIWTRPYTSGRVRTLYDPMGSWTYGRFEVRAKMPKGKHLWPAIWMLPTDYDYGVWPKSGEIDILEARGQETDIVSSAMHYGPAWPNNQHITTGKIQFPGVDFSADYHIYALEWDEKEMRYYVDNNNTWTVNLDRIWYSGTYTENGQPWNKRFHFILNLAIGGAFFNGYGSLTTAEALKWEQPHLSVDYVRVYQKSTAVCGDGMCTEDETIHTCPADCDNVSGTTETENPTESTPDDTGAPTPTDGNPTCCNCCPTNTDSQDPNFNQAEQDGVNVGSSSNYSDLESQVTSHNGAIQALAIVEAVLGVALIAATVSMVMLIKKLKSAYTLNVATVSPSDNNVSMHNM